MERQLSESPCLVCHEAIEIFAIGSCDHPICFKCSTRMRALCDQFYCPTCRTDLPEVFFMLKPEKFGEMPIRKFICNKKLKIQFEQNSVRERTEELLEHRCRLCKDRYPEKSFKALRDHMRRQHTEFFCDLCLELKIFTSERKFYNRQTLAAHRRLGDKDDTSYKGHPLCQFCDERYLDKDELYKHLRKDHYFCHFCEADGSQDFFHNYEALRDHFQTDHFLCEEDDCVDKQFENAFRSEIDIKGHRATHHSKACSKHQSRQERAINIDINLVPRPRVNRGRGAVGKEDYEEYQQGSQGRGAASQGRGAESRQGHRGGRGMGSEEYQQGSQGRGAASQGRGAESRQGHRGGRGMGREQRDIERAMQASLSTMKEEVNKPPQKEDAKKVVQKETFVHDEQNFPTLAGETVTKSGPTTADNSTSDGAKSLADRFALSHNMSVQHGMLAMSDFPTLSQDNNSASSITAEPHRNLVPPRKTNGRRSPFSNTSANKTIEEDFPQLPVSSKKVSSSKSSSSWDSPGDPKDFPQLPVSSKKVSSSKSSSKSSSSWDSSGNPKVTSSSAPSQSQPIVSFTKPKKMKNSNKSDFVRKNKNTYDETDFPTLGIPANTMTGKWYKNGRDSPSAVKGSFPVEDSASSENSSEGYTNIIDRYSPVNIPDSPKSKTKKKKKKEKLDLPDKNATTQLKNSEKADRLRGNSSLDDIASLLLPSTIQSESASSKSAVKTSKNASISDNDAVAITENKPEHQVDWKYIEVLEHDVEPTPEAPVSFAISGDDFPSLGTPAKGKKPPPGFRKEEADMRSPPPGFNTVTTPPPPGFVSPPKVEPSVIIAGTDGSIPVTLMNFEYSQPDGFTGRNKQLIGAIQNVLADDQFKFAEFKTLSGEFRRAEVTASQYYYRCEEILGKDKFAEIFSELLALLPDIEKQHELMSVYMSTEGMKKDSKGAVLKISGKTKYMKGAWTPTQSGFLTCPTCRQVLVRRDYNKHVEIHNLDSDFPSLHSDSVPAQQLGLGAWVKAK